MAEERGERVRLPSIGDATWRGFYFQQLRHVFGLFPRDQILVLQFERCVQDPVGEMARTWRFLDVDPPAKAPDRLLKHRQVGRGTPALSPDLSEALAHRYREDSARLAELCPEIDLSLWTSLGGRGRASSDARVDAAVS
jgi:hypothetical protein